MRCFIALEISGEIKGKLEKVKRELGIDGLKLVEPENTHLTLKFLGEVEEEQVENVKKALDGLARNSFSMKVQGIGVFPKPEFVRVVWAGAESEELKQLAEDLNEALAKLGFKQESFTGHVTLARVKKKVDLSSFITSHEKDEFGESKISRIILKNSTLTPKGPVYEDVYEVKLKD